MKRSAIVVGIATLLMVSAMSSSARAAVQPGTTVTWVGGASGEWNDADAWKRNSDNVIGNAQTLLGSTRGSNGADTSPTSGANIIIGGGSTVEYYWPANNDMIIKQGSNLIIRDGATLVQETDGTYEENGWTQLDPSNLILDGGTFRRTGASPAGDGGGLLLMGSYRADDNFAQIPAPAKINALITNGGSLQNEGDFWFGAGDETPQDGVHVKFEINNGTIDLTGGDVEADEQEGVVGTSDLMFVYPMHLVDLVPVDAQYVLNFTGPGSITVDHSGINIAKQDASFTYLGRNGSDPYTTLVTYQELWEDGILRSHGLSGLDGLDFNNFFTVTGTSGADNYKVEAKTGTTVTWDGGNGAWFDAKWNSGQTSQTAFGSDSGTENAHNIVIGGGAQVTYTSDSTTLFNADFRVRSDNGPASLTIKQGAKLSITSSNTDVDSKWTQFDGDLTLDNGTLARDWVPGGEPPMVSGGALVFGTWNSRQNQQIDVNITNGGRLENDGQVWLGAGEDHGSGLEVTITINNGTIDLTGGDNEPLIKAGGPEADLNIFYDYDDFALVPGPKNEQYAINFTGPGSITVDHSGIAVYRQDEFGVSDMALKTYQDLWDLGILQANGLSGLDGVNFSSFFTTAGSLGSNDYTLTSLLTSGNNADYDADGDVDGNDFLTWQRTFGQTVTPGSGADGDGNGTIDAADLAVWKGGFGSAVAAGSGAVGAVPEPTSLAIALLGLTSLAIGGSRRAAQTVRRKQ